MTQHTDITLTFEEILAASRCRRDWLLELIEEEIISVNGRPEQTLYSGFLGLIMRLLDEVEELRKAQQPLSLLDEGK